MVICSYALRAYMKSNFNYTYRYVAEPLFGTWIKLKKEIRRSRENGQSYEKHTRMYRYVILSFIFSPPVLIILLLLLYTAMSN